SSILEMLKEYEVTEFELERGEQKIALKRGSASQVAELAAEIKKAVQPVPAPVTVSHIQAAPQPTNSVSDPGNSAAVPAPAANPASAPEGSDKLASGEEIPSPMVGTFYRRPAIDADPYVEVGDRVKKGDVLCIVEAMKLMNEIESTVTGRIAEIYLEDGQMVEYGESLFRIETD
ncbi:acetyl-CoA carboxylase, biotin carboxyl carrier protein, partial [bacterium J17]